MKMLHSNWKYSRYVYLGVGLVWIGYVLLLFLAKSNNTYHLGTEAINIIRVTFAVPILLIWLTAALAAVRFKGYANLIAGSPEAPAFKRLASGLFWLLIYLVSLLMLGRIAPLFAGTDYVYAAVFVKNHVPVLLLVVSFIQLYRGATHLADGAGIRPTRGALLTTNLTYLTFSVGFVAFFFSNLPARNALIGNIPAFAFPNEVLLFTLILPSLIAWELGIFACIILYAYARNAKGRIYKSFVNQLLIGIAATTTFTILMQLLVLSSSQLRSLGLNMILIIVYLFLVAYAVGSIFIARSAARLTLIEEAK